MVKWWEEELFSHFVVPFGVISVHKPALHPYVFTDGRTGERARETRITCSVTFTAINPCRRRPTRICSACILLLLLLLLGPVVLVRHRGVRTCTPNLATYVVQPRSTSSSARLLSARAVITISDPILRLHRKQVFQFVMLRDRRRTYWEANVSGRGLIRLSPIPSCGCHCSIAGS